MKVKKEVLAIAEQIFRSSGEMLETEGSVPWMAVVVTMDASAEGSYKTEVLSLIGNKDQAKSYIVSRARTTNAVAVIMLGEAYMTKLTEGAREKFEVIYSALRMYDDSLAMKAAKIVRENGKARVGDKICLGDTGEVRMIANILPSWNAMAHA